MTALNMQMLPTNMPPLDFLPVHPNHSRSNSVSSNSTHSSHSRPHSSHSAMGRMQPGVGPSPEDLYRASYHLGHQNIMHNDLVRTPLPFLPPPQANVYPSVAPQPQYHQPCSQRSFSPKSHPSSCRRVTLPPRHRQRPFILQRDRRYIHVSTDLGSRLSLNVRGCVHHGP